MISFNQVTVIGNLTADPELKALTDGKYVASFDIAVNESYKNKEGVKVETVEFVKCNAFGKGAELIAQYMKKGGQLLIQGKLKTHTWETENVKHYQTRVVVKEFAFGSNVQKVETKPVEDKNLMKPSTVEYPTEDINPADIPFS